jgi:pimeloyl-ACP methyl ester carboxylesterase
MNHIFQLKIKLLSIVIFFAIGVHAQGKGCIAYMGNNITYDSNVITRDLCEFVKLESDPDFDLVKQLPGEKTLFNFHGFNGYDFNFCGRNAKVVVPEKVAAGHPWVWRARFWGHEPQADLALLGKGFHIVYCDVAELFGNDEALSIWDNFYRMLTGNGLAEKAVMEGMSRGGIYIYRWAAKYPERVAAVYADAPVLDLKSWPGGKGTAQGSPEVWETFKADFGFITDEEAIAFKGNPLDLAEKIAKAGFPMLHVVGDADEVVPVIENTLPFERRIREAGGSIQVIHKPGVGHHPHSLSNPQPIVNFILMAIKDKEE